MKPSNAQHIIDEIKDTLDKHRPELLRWIECGEINLITRRQIQMRDPKDPTAFDHFVKQYINEHDLPPKTAYTLVESEYQRAYGERRYKTRKSYQNSYSRRKLSNSVGQNQRKS